MSLPLPLALCLGGVFCLSPLSLYFLWLASVSRRSGPVVVTGHWDFVVALLGLSGLLYAGNMTVAAAGPVVLVSQQPDSFTAAYQLVGRAGTAGPDAAFAYRCAVAAFVLFGVWGRRDSLSVYNIDPSAVPGVVGDAAGAVGVPAEPALSWSRWPFLGHVSVAVRRLGPVATTEVLRELRSHLTAAPTGRGRASGWFTLVAAVLITGSFLLIGTFLRLTRNI